MIVRNQGSKISVQQILNFHEGGSEFSVNKDGSLSVSEPGGADMSNLSVTVLDNSSFALGSDRYKPAKYIFVKNAPDFVAGVILAGKYRDARGREYEFGRDGWASFPERRFKYEIGLDHVLNGFEYYMVGEKIWALKRKGDDLEIFATTDGSQGPEEPLPGPPFVSLRPVK